MIDEKIGLVKKLLLISSIFLGVTCIPIIIIGFFSLPILIYGMFFLGLACSNFFISRSEERILKYPNFILIAGLLSLFAGNIVSVTLNMISYVKVIKYIKFKNGNVVKSNRKLKRERISRQKKKTDILTKIGVFLVVLSGLIISTSNPTHIYLKPIILLGFSALFYCLYYIFDRKIIIKNSSKIYYILFYAFILLVGISLGYYRVFGDYFSFFGEGKFLFIFLLNILLCICLSMFNKKYQFIYSDEIISVFAFCSLIFLFLFFNIEYIVILCLMILINYLVFTKYDKVPSGVINGNDIFLFVDVILYLICVNFYNQYAFLSLLSGFFIIYYLYVRINTSEKLSYLCRGLLPIFSSLFVWFNLRNYFFGTVPYYFICIICLLVLNFIFLKSKHKDLLFSGYISTLIISLVINTLMIINGYYLFGLIASVILLIYYICLFIKGESNFYKISSFGLIICGNAFLSISSYLFCRDQIVISYDVCIYLFFILSLIVTLILSKKLISLKLFKGMYYTSLICLCMTSILYCYNHGVLFNIVVFMILFAFRYLFKVIRRNNYYINLIYILCTIIYVLVLLYSYSNVLVISTLLFIALLITAYYLNRNKILSNYILIASYIPYYYMVSNMYFAPDYVIPCLKAIALAVVLYLFTRGVFKFGKVTNFVIEFIGLTLIFSTLLFDNHLVVFLILFFVSVLMILLGNRLENYNSLFYFGAIYLFINVLHEINNLWDSVPIYVYLLFFGLVILLYVTVSEKKGNKKKKNDNDIVDNISLSYLMSNIGLLMVLVIVFVIYGMSIDHIDYKAKEEMIYNTLEIKKIDNSKIYFVSSIKDSSVYLYIEKGYHFDIKIFENTFFDRCGDKTLYVLWVEREDLKMYKENHSRVKSARDVYKDINETHYFDGEMGIDIKNEVNFLDVYYNSDGFSIYYNPNDVDYLEICVNPNIKHKIVDEHENEYLVSHCDKYVSESGQIDIIKITE